MIAERQLSSTAVLYNCWLYTNQGSGEKSLILRQLQDVKCGKTNGLRFWAVEMKVALPGGTLVMKTLENAAQTDGGKG